MAFNGSGVFNLVYDWNADAVNGIKIRSDRMMGQETDMAANGFGLCLTRDGQGAASANLPMNGFLHTGVGNATAANEYAAVGQIQSGSFLFGVSGGTSDAITAAFTPAITALTNGMIVTFSAGSANATATPTFRADGTTAHTITKLGGQALNGNDIAGAGFRPILQYSLATTSWELLNPATVGPAVSINVLDSKFAIINAADTTKIADFSAASITTGTTRTYTFPDVSSTLAVLAAQTFTGAQTFGSTISVTSSATAASFIPSGSTVPTNGIYLPAANSVAIATNSTLGLYQTSTQDVGIATSTPNFASGTGRFFTVIGDSGARGNIGAACNASTSTAAANFISGSYRVYATTNTASGAGGTNVFAIDVVTEGTSNNERGANAQFWCKQDTTVESRKFTIAPAGSLFITDRTAPASVTQFANVGSLNGEIVSIIGTALSSANYGTLELATTAVDGTNQTAGILAHSAKNNTTQPQITAIIGTVVGGTANNRGGQLDFYTKPNNGTSFNNPVTITNQGHLLVNSGADTATLSVGGSLAISTTSVFTGVATFTAAPVFTDAPGSRSALNIHTSTSSDQAVAVSSSITFTHGLGAVPSYVLYELVCQSNDGGWTSGNVIQTVPGSTGSNQGFTSQITSTQIGIIFGSGSGGKALTYLNPSTNASISLTDANWKMRIIAGLN